jgi:hypothetical protein
MTSESDSTPPRRQPTIDLTATEVGPDKPAESEAPPKEEAPPAPSAEPATRSSRSHVLSALAGGAAGGIVIAAIIVALQATGHWPVREGEAPGTPVTPAPATAANEAAIADLTAQLNKIQSTLSTQQPDSALVSRLASVEATTKSLSDSLNKLTSRIDQAATAAQGAQAQAKAAADTAGAAKTSAQGGIARSDLDALTSRVAALESTAKSLSDAVSRQAAGGGADGAARLMIVAEALRVAVERGVPFQTELAAAKSLGADQTTIAPLEPLAASGAPSAAALTHELATLAPALAEAVEPKQTQNTFLDRIESNAQRLVRSTPIDAPAGDDPRSVAMRINFDATRGDIGAALTDIAKLPDAAKAIAAPWVQKVQARNAAVAAGSQLTANALAALSKAQ